MRASVRVSLLSGVVVASLGCASGRPENVRPGVDAATDGTAADDDAFAPLDLDAAGLGEDAWRIEPDAFVPVGTDAAVVLTDAWSPDAWARDAYTRPPDAWAGECTTGRTEACTTSCGSMGSRTCVAALWGACTAPAETCNARDDDCDGATDDGSLCAADEACLGGSCRRTRWVFEAETDLAHGFGRAEGDGWSAATGPDARGVLLYGPYTTEIPAGAATATFRLMVDNRSADDNVVVRLEVNDFDGRGPDCGDCVIASREVRRMSWSAPMSYQDFALSFSAIAGHRLEFRTYWTDISYVREDRVVVTSP